MSAAEVSIDRCFERFMKILAISEGHKRGPFRAHMPTWKKQQAAKFRSNLTGAEFVLYQILKNHTPYRVRTQAPMLGYITDFYIAEFRMAIEADGGSHRDRQVYDRQRDQALARVGITTLRIPNELITDENASEIAWLVMSCASRVKGSTERTFEKRVYNLEGARGESPIEELGEATELPSGGELAPNPVSGAATECVHDWMVPAHADDGVPVCTKCGLQGWPAPTFPYSTNCKVNL